MNLPTLSRQRTLLVCVLFPALLVSWLLPMTRAQAQGGNLLTNANFEQQHGNGMELIAPPGWNIWAANAPHNEDWQNLIPVAEWTSDPRFVHEGFGSFHAYKQWATFNVAIYQTVGGIEPGSTLQLSAYGRIWSCQERAGQEPCLTGTTPRNESDTGASFRVGIDSAGSNDPNAGTIVFSGAIAPYTGYQQASVQATATGGSVTVVLSARMDWPSEHQDVFWDQAALTVIAPPGASSGGGSGGDTGGTSGGGTQTGEAQSNTGQTASNAGGLSGATGAGIAAEVLAQGPRADGSIVHTVRPGDTLAGIAVAYGITIERLLTLNGLSPETRYIYPGQELIIQPGPDAASADEAGEEATDQATPGDEEGESSETEEGETGEEAGDEEVAEAATPQPTVQPIEDYEPAPVAAAAVPALSLEDLATSARVCASLFEDTNPNRLHESGEVFLAGGEIALSLDGATLDSFTTDADDQPYCFEGLAPGRYLVSLGLPEGYGATTPASYTISLEAGQTVEALFGAAEGFVPPQPPLVVGGGLFSDETGTEPDTRQGGLLETVARNSGVIVLGLAGVVLLGGVILTLVLRR